MDTAARLYRVGRVWYCWYYDQNGKQRRLSTRCVDREAATAVALRMERVAHGRPAQGDEFWFRGPFTSFVYFIQQGDAGPIKIGRAGKTDDRIAQLQTASPVKLRLLCAVPGGLQLERSLHASFKATRLEGEWFEPTRRLLGLVAEIQEQWSLVPDDHATGSSIAPPPTT